MRVEGGKKKPIRVASYQAVSLRRGVGRNVGWREENQDEDMKVGNKKIERRAAAGSKV
jgi:hypothetical protein